MAGVWDYGVGEGYFAVVGDCECQCGVDGAAEGVLRDMSARRYGSKMYLRGKDCWQGRICLAVRRR